MLSGVVYSGVKVLGEFKTFIFTGEGSDMTLQNAGVQELLKSETSSEKVCGNVHIWGYHVPIIKPAEVLPTPESCIILFEYHRPFRHYHGILVQNEERVINIAENRA